jgi:uncharacterized protein (TIGR02452 family)
MNRSQRARQAEETLAVLDRGLRNVACLNFASAKNPGGGFLRGSQAQEESLARSSGLYACISRMNGYYAANRSCGTALYTDHIIYSPRVPVFRDDAGGLLDEPYLVSFITAPAVNAGAVRKNEPARVPEILPVMRRRAEHVLKVALAHGDRHLILGAWGCGVFQNDPADIAHVFGALLLESDDFRDNFCSVVFAVLDRTTDGKIIGPFREMCKGSDRQAR